MNPKVTKRLNFCPIILKWFIIIESSKSSKQLLQCYHAYLLGSLLFQGNKSMLLIGKGHHYMS